MSKPYVSSVMNAEKIKSCPKMFQSSMFKQTIQGKYMDVTSWKLKANQHLVVVDYKSVCIFERKLPNVTSSSVFESLKSIFCDVRAPDKLISDNVRYFVSDEYEVFTAKWNIVHVTSSPRYPQGNSQIEKAIQSVKAIYEKFTMSKWDCCYWKPTPVVSGHDQKSPAESFCKCKLKANLPIIWSAQWASDHDRDEPVMTSKFGNHDAIWCKVDPKPGHIIDVLPNWSVLFNRTWWW